MDKLKIDISEELIRFEDHLKLIGNNQIIVSGIFGIGKTYFINEFFETYIDKYNTVKISPVNYSVSNNEDIFEYIKYDIIIELLSRNIEFKKIDFSKFLTAQFFIKNKHFRIKVTFL